MKCKTDKRWQCHLLCCTMVLAKIAEKKWAYAGKANIKSIWYLPEKINTRKEKTYGKEEKETRISGNAG